MVGIGVSALVGKYVLLWFLFSAPWQRSTQTPCFWVFDEAKKKVVASRRRWPTRDEG